jgi:hypothetical protein
MKYQQFLFLLRFDAMCRRPKNTTSHFSKLAYGTQNELLPSKMFGVKVESVVRTIK